MASVTLRDIRKSFQPLEVIHGVSLDIEDGEFVSLVGPSGCGKSTLLRMIAGLEEITSGTLRIGDRTVNDLEAKDRDIAMVFQNYALYPHLTVAENLGFSLKMRNAGAAETESRVGDAANILGLETLLERKPKQLSGGQRQRVAMGRAIVRDPKVFLFDEPLSNLDAKLRVQMRAEIKTLHRRLGTTMIYVTHDQIEAMTMSDRIVVLRNGIVEQVGAPLDLYERPRNTFVAEFIGSPAMNLLAMEAGEHGLRLTGLTGLTGREGGFDVPVPRRGALLVGVRPDDLTLSDDGGLTGEVVLVEPTGSETVLTVDVGLDRPVTVLSRDRRRIREGERLHLHPDPDRLHFFDPASGARIEQP